MKDACIQHFHRIRWETHNEKIANQMHSSLWAMKRAIMKGMCRGISTKSPVSHLIFLLFFFMTRKWWNNILRIDLVVNCKCEARQFKERLLEKKIQHVYQVRLGYTRYVCKSKYHVIDLFCWFRCVAFVFFSCSLFFFSPPSPLRCVPWKAFFSREVVQPLCSLVDSRLVVLAVKLATTKWWTK